MDGELRDAVIHLGGPLPVIGGGIVIIAILAWLAYQAYQSEERSLAFFIGSVAAGVLLAVAISVPAAKASCRNLYDTNEIEFSQKNCSLIVTCSAHGLPGSAPVCT